ncbi:MAG: T9SS type A sorting domain-containing protein [Bacteroidota bacterium]
MIRLFTFIGLIILSLPAYAQFSYDLWTTNYRTGLPGETLIILGDLVNNSGEDITIHITRTEENVPGDWETAMCTDVCQIPSISQVNYTLLWGEYQTYSMYFYTSPLNEGSGDVTIRMVNLADTTNVITQEFFASTETAVSNSQVTDLGNQVMVFPTLVNDVINFKLPPTLFIRSEDLRLNIFNASGNLVHSTFVTNELTQISRDNLSTGTYFFSLQDESGVIKSGKLMFQ